jgi:hypothetical protein
MEALTRLVTESLVRHGFDRPVDYRRLHWSRWFRCESHHSLLVVPSKPGVFAIAEEIMDFSAHVATGASSPEAGSRAPQARRMLAVTQFFEDDDMAFVLDRMLSRRSPVGSQLTSAHLASGRYFVRFVVIDDQTQRRSVCTALNQWMANSAEKATGIGAHFATSLELTPATEYIPQPDERQQNLFDDSGSGASSARVETAASPVPRREASGLSTNLSLSPSTSTPTTPHLDSGAATNIHCPSPLPSGF